MVAVLQQLVANLAPKVKRVSVNGRTYLVAPASLIVPGVLNGSDGAGYYSAEENAKSAKDWDGIPLVAYHPLRNGQPVAAQDPEHREWVWANSGLGHLRNSRNNGKLTAEAWFDEELVKNYDLKLPKHARILPRLEKHQPIELSTGLLLDKDVQNGTCPTTGRSYDWVARNYKPDHLAVLPDQRGACSVEDGCGVVVNSNPEGINQYTSGARGASEAVKGRSKKADEASDKAHAASEKADKSATRSSSKSGSHANEIRGGVSEHETARDAHSHAAEQHMKAARATPKSQDSMPHAVSAAAHYRASDAHDRLTRNDDGCGIVVNAGKHGNPQHAESGQYLPHGAGTGKGEQHAAAVDGHKPKAALASQAEEEGEPDGAPADNCTSLPMTTKNADGWVTLPNGVHVEIKDGEIVKGPKVGKAEGSVAGHDHGKEALAHAKDAQEAGVGKFPNRALKASQRASSMSQSARTPEEHRAAAEAHDEAADIHERSGDKVFGHAATQHSLAAEAHRDAARPTKNSNSKENDMAGTTANKISDAERRGLVEKLVANCRCGDSAPDVEVLNKLSDFALLRLNEMAKDDGEMDSAADEDNTPKKKLPPQFAKNQESIKVSLDSNAITNAVKNAQPKTAKEWLESAPVEIRGAVTNALKVERRAKEQLIGRLTANVAKEQQAKYATFLSNKTLDELETLVELIPSATVNASDGLFDAKGDVAPVFVGANGGFEGTRNAEAGFVLNANPEMDPQYWANKQKSTIGAA